MAANCIRVGICYCPWNQADVTNILASDDHSFKNIAIGPAYHQSSVLAKPFTLSRFLIKNTRALTLSCRLCKGMRDACILFSTSNGSDTNADSIEEGFRVSDFRTLIFSPGSRKPVSYCIVDGPPHTDSEGQSETRYANLWTFEEFIASDE